MNKKPFHKRNSQAKGGVPQNRIADKADDSKKTSELLSWKDNRTNFYEWKELAANEAGEDHHLLAAIVRDIPDDYAINPIPTRPAGLPNTAAHDIYKLDLELWNDQRKKLTNQKPKLYYWLLTKCTESSINRIKSRVEEYRIAKEAECPLLLMKLLRSTHLSELIPGGDIDKENAAKNFHTCFQRSGEEIDHFKIRFENILSVMEFSGCTMPTMPERITRFFSGLDRVRYVQLTTNIATGSTPKPDTLEKAADLASAYCIASKPLFRNVQVAYNVNNYNKSNSNNNNNNNKNNKNNNNNNNKPNSKSKSVDTNESKETVDIKKPNTCWSCGEPGHSKWNCPNKQLAEGAKRHRAHATFGSTKYLGYKVSRSYGLTSNDIMLDNQATSSIFTNSSLLNNITTIRNPRIFSGLGDATCECNEVGSFLGLSDISLSIDAGVNIISIIDATNYGIKITYDQGVGFYTTWPDGSEMFFACRSNGLHTYRADEFAYKSTLCLTDEPTVTDVTNDIDLYNTNSSDDVFQSGTSKSAVSTICIPNTSKQLAMATQLLYSNKQFEAASEARKLKRTLGHVSDGELINILNSNMLMNCDVQASSVRLANEIFGKDIGELKGKSTLRKAQRTMLFEGIVTAQRKQTLYIDIAVFCGFYFLISVSEPLGMTVTIWLGNERNAKNHESIVFALRTTLKVYNNKKFLITKARHDGEPNLVSCKSYLRDRGIDVDICGPNNHVPQVERKIRTIKERLRSVLNSLEFRLPVSLLSNLLAFVTIRTNMCHTSGGYLGVTPYEAYHERRINYPIDLRIPFGVLVETVEGDRKNRNDMQQRTMSAISLEPTGNLEGSVNFLSLDTLRVVTRTKWTEIPMNKIVQETMAKLCLKFGHVDNPEKQSGLNDEAITSSSSDDVFQSGTSKSTVLVGDSSRHAIHEVSTNSELSVGSEPEIGLATASHSEFNESSTLSGDGDITMFGTFATPASDPVVIYSEDIGTTAPEVYCVNSTNKGLVADRSYKVFDLSFGGVVKGEKSYKVRVNDIYDKETTHCQHQMDPQFKVYITSVSDALKSERSVENIDAMYAEMKSMDQKGVFKVTQPNSLTLEERKQIIPSKMFVKEKYSADGKFDKIKARLVAGGHRQYAITKEESSSSTISTICVLIVLFLACKHKMKLFKIDVGTAYLNADMQGEPVHMWLSSQVSSIYSLMHPELIKYRDDKGRFVVKLVKALYGCKQAGKCWFDTISKFYIDFGFKPIQYDSCCFTMNTKNGYVCILLLHVDDTLCCCDDITFVQQLMSSMESRFGKISVDEGNSIDYLGMKINILSNGIFELSMKKFIEDLLLKNQVVKFAQSPASNDLFDIDESSKLLGENYKEDFHSTVASLLYLSKRTRSDILLAVNFLCSRTLAPTEQDSKKLDHLLKYINATRDLKMNIHPNQSTTIETYIDASYGVHKDAKSQSGAVIMIGGNVIEAKSIKQKTISKSSSESELNALSDLAGLGIWTSQILSQLGETFDHVIYQDNRACIDLTKAGKPLSDRSKHLLIRSLWLCEQVANGTIDLQWICTEEMLADVMTKPLQGIKFRDFRNKLLGTVS